MTARINTNSPSRNVTKKAIGYGLVSGIVVFLVLCALFMQRAGNNLPQDQLLHVLPIWISSLLGLLVGSLVYVRLGRDENLGRSRNILQMMILFVSVSLDFPIFMSSILIGPEKVAAILANLLLAFILFVAVEWAEKAPRA